MTQGFKPNDLRGEVDKGAEYFIELAKQKKAQKNIEQNTGGFTDNIPISSMTSETEQSINTPEQPAAPEQPKINLFKFSNSAVDELSKQLGVEEEVTPVAPETTPESTPKPTPAAPEPKQPVKNRFKFSNSAVDELSKQLGVEDNEPVTENRVEPEEVNSPQPVKPEKKQEFNPFEKYNCQDTEGIRKIFNSEENYTRQKDRNYNRQETQDAVARKQKYRSVIDDVWNNPQPQDNIVPKTRTFTYNGANIEYSSMEDNISFAQSFETVMSEDDLAENYVNLTKEVCDDIERLCGGWDRVTSLAVISDDIIINGVAYKPNIPDTWLSSVPFDLRMRLQDRRFAWVFDFVHLKEMVNLTDLKFDTMSFVRSKVRGDINLIVGLDYGTFFRMCKRLNDIEIAGQHVTRAEYKARTIQSDLFSNPTNEFLDKCYSFCDDWSVRLTKNRFRAITDMFHSNAKPLQKAWGVAWRTPLLALGVSSVVATKGSGVLRKMLSGLRNVVDTVRENK